MKVDENAKLKREQIEINIVEMFKYICVRSVWVLLFAVIIAIIVPSLKYVNDKKNVTDMQEALGNSTQETDKLQSYIKELELYENAYKTEKEYRDNSVLMKLDYKNINTAAVQFYVSADEEYLLDALSAYTIYSNDGGLVADICEIDNSINESYLKEIIRVTCSNYGSYDVSSLIGIRIYGESRESCEHYVEIVTQVLNEYSDLLNSIGIQNKIDMIYENYYVALDNTVWTSQKTLNNTITEIENNIAVVQTEIDMLRSQGVTSAEEILNSNAEKNVAFSIKYAIVGFAIGLILALMFLVIKYLISSKVKYANELSEATGIQLIGDIRVNRKGISNRLFKNLIFKDKYAAVREERLIYKVKSMCDYHKAEEVTIIGNSEACEVDKVKSIEERLKEQKIALKKTGDVVNSIEAMKKLNSCENVIIVVLSNKTSYAYIEELMKLCAVKEANVLGYIYFD